jgi:MoaA/NifB/PqqE/SkfB family radical SAM enzyme
MACQCACRVCYERHDPLFRGMQPAAMDVGRFERLLGQARGFLRRPLIHLYGGEPLLHPQFAELVGLLGREGFEASMNTNGELLAEHAATLAGSPVRTVLVSLDDVGERHDALRGRPGLFVHAVAGIRRLRELDPKASLNVNLVVHPENAPRLEEALLGIEQALHGVRLDHLSIEQLAFTPAMANLAREVDAAALRESLRRIAARRFAFPVSATPLIAPDDLERYYRDAAPFDRVNCNVPWIALNVFPNGDISPGGGMFACTRTVGNLETTPLTELWNGEAMRAFRRKIRGAMPADCFRCCHTLHYSPLITCRPARR